jgi:hypothetical protein
MSHDPRQYFSIAPMKAVKRSTQSEQRPRCLVLNTRKLIVAIQRGDIRSITGCASKPLLRLADILAAIDC